MKKIVIFGNSGAGKTTLAKSLKTEFNLAHLDLDSLAWEKEEEPVRRALDDSYVEIKSFIDKNNSWVIEGCYADLISLLTPYANEMIYLNISTEDCIKNARNRAWEPHKYKTKEEQDSNLKFLIKWIEDYEIRDDELSKKAHMSLFNEFSGKKKKIDEI